MQLHKITHLLTRLRAYLGSLGWKKLTLGAIGIVLVLIIGRMSFGQSAAEVLEASTPCVELRSVAELSAEGSPISIAGTVSSQSEATVRAESSGAVTAVYHSLGQFVSAGTIVAELESSSQRAAVLQAQGSVDAAQANVDRVSIGVGTSKNTAITALLSAYAAIDSAVHGSADTMILNPDSSSAQFSVTSSNSQAVTKINATRPTLTSLFARESARASSLSVNDDLLSELTKTQSELRTTQIFIDLIITALNTAIETPNMPQATISSYLASATAARASLNGALSGLSSAEAALSTSQSSGSAVSPEVSAALAGLKQAQGSLAAARANLEKAIIRAPISGTINSFSLKRGDFVSPSSPVLTVANNSALEITAYVTSQDVSSIVVGNKVTLEGGNSGVITHVAPAIDPVTKKIEVRIGVAGNSSLVNGQSVLINFPHSTPVGSKAPTRITIPITAIKVGSSGVDVFTIASTTSPTGETTLVAHKIVLGELLGNSVAVSEGLTPEMMIVVDARGLKNGETVTVAN